MNTPLGTTRTSRPPNFQRLEVATLQGRTVKDYSYRQMRKLAVEEQGAAGASTLTTYSEFNDGAKHCLARPTCGCEVCTDIRCHRAYIRARDAIERVSISSTEFQDKYLEVRDAILSSHRRRGSDEFWIQWIEGILQVEPSNESMSRADFYSEVICHPYERLMLDLRNVVAAYFAHFYAVRWPIGHEV